MKKPLPDHQETHIVEVSDSTAQFEPKVHMRVTNIRCSVPGEIWVARLRVDDEMNDEGDLKYPCLAGPGMTITIVPKTPPPRRKGRQKPLSSVAVELRGINLTSMAVPLERQMYSPSRHVLRVVGHPQSVLIARTGPSSCSGQEDLVTFYHGCETDGAWCVPFEDLEKFYLAAKKSRENKVVD